LTSGKPSKGLAHVFPEAVWPHWGTLPRGSVCDPCNNYLGQLDNSLINHPFIALALQFHGIPGKKGSTRDTIGFIDRTIHPGAITWPCPEPTPIYDLLGRRTGHDVKLLYPKKFSACKFRRSLHHIAFNLVAMDGVERVYGSEYDEARRYIRKPKRDEEWPIGQHVISLTHLPKKVLGGIYESDVDEYVGLRFFSIVFFVDLLRKGDFTTFLRDHQPPGTLLLEPGLVFPRLEPNGLRRYRVTVCPDSGPEESPSPKFSREIVSGGAK
jgi:hypothetical protein